MFAVSVTEYKYKWQLPPLQQAITQLRHLLLHWLVPFCMFLCPTSIGCVCSIKGSGNFTADSDGEINTSNFGLRGGSKSTQHPPAQ
jgi:hypothetical protein